MSILLFFLLSTAAAADPPSLRLPAAEQEAAYLALESINPTTDWRSVYPDDLCLYGPHGIVCDLFPNSSAAAGGISIPHITELNFGFVSDFSSNPNCSPNATLPSLSPASFPFLRKLFFYNCFLVSEVPFGSHFLTSAPSDLQELVFINNLALAGRLPAAIGDFPNLRRLIFSDTGISGNIPVEIGKLINLDQLVLSRNRLRGEIPSSVGSLHRLKILDLSWNRLGGSIPASIGRLSELVKLDLSSNRIAGPVPAEFAALLKVEFLDLSYNRLTGGVPTAMAEMVSLREAYFSGNRFGGPIPEIWEKLGGILGLGMSNLGLVGNIPASMGVFLENLCYLALDGNFLEGALPEQLKRLERTAREINLENNALEGRIPFSAGFVVRMGGKLKLGGNPKLCGGGDLVGHAREMGNLARCKNTEIPIPVSFSLSGSSEWKNPSLFGITLLGLCLFLGS